MKKEIIYVILVVFSFFSCEKEKIEVYHGADYVQFDKAWSDSSTISFVFYSGRSEVKIPVVSRLSSFASGTEREYRLVVNKEFSTAEENVHFSLPEKTVFKPGAIIDTAYVTFYLKPEMETAAFRLVVELEANENFELGQLEHQMNIFWVHNMISRPDWWTTSVENNYLGKYSDAKYRLLLQVWPKDLEGSNDSEKRAAALQLKYHLEENPVWDKDNNEQMRVSVKS